MRYQELIGELTSPDILSRTNNRELAHTFARDFGWRPSDYHPAHLSKIANSHLLVEHGLKNTAVLTFLQSPNYFSALSAFQVQELLNFSYNNLIDWHLIISRNEAVTIYNRVKDSQRRIVHTVQLQEPKAFDELRSERFEQIIGRKPNPNLPALDDALIKNISHWKRSLSVDIENVSTIQLSALFNAVIFARAVEDSARYSALREDSNSKFPEKYLLNLWDYSKEQLGLEEILSQSISGLLKEEIPKYLLETEEIKIFNQIDYSTIRSLITSFYYQESIPYSYDFSVMSKHALSRLYEQYVSILKTIEPLEMAQRPLFKFQLPKQESNKAYGAFYTPQYIARFFARFFRKVSSPKTFIKAMTTDPACGSGIFLRTFLEQRFDEIVENSINDITPDLVRQSFQNVLGIDIDSNAIHATGLSLALLQLALKDSFPEQLATLENFPQTLQLFESEGIGFIEENFELLKNSQDVVVANPPFVRIEDQPEAIRERIALFIGKYAEAKGRISSELAFLLIGLELLKPNGIGFFVLQHSFMILDSARPIREKLLEEAWILCLADLSSIDVFQNTGVYTLLLIFQKKDESNNYPKATIVDCKDFVEKALQDVLDGAEVETKAYSVYEVEQSYFDSKHWSVVSKSELYVEEKLNQLPKVSDFLEVRQGFVTGADDIFIRHNQEISNQERNIYIPYLPDREMSVYTMPEQVNKVVFYPYIKGEMISENELSERFPDTWKYLSSHKEELLTRSGITELTWWKPTRSRPPERMLRPKIITPHLTISPRFSLDLEGKFAVSRSPMLFPKDNIVNEKDLLRFFTAVLNSSVCFWYISKHSHKYKKGYAMLELKTLSNIRVPSPNSFPLNVKSIIKLVDERLISSGLKAISLEQEIDSIVSSMYGLTEEERNILNLRG